MRNKVARHDSAKGKILGAAIVVIMVALGAWWYFSRLPDAGITLERHPAASTGAPSVEPPPIEHPISLAQTGTPAIASTVPLPLPLPSLADSGSAAAAALAAIPGASELAQLLLAHGLIPHLVATIDALPRHASIGSNILPLRTPAGTFKVRTADGQSSIDPANYARYQPYMHIVERVDPRSLVAWYVRWYPLFQQAYRELGYPHGYFNDRLIAALDNLLAAPNTNGAIELTATTRGHFALADPTWESLSAGQKLMLRMGPDNERQVKIKLNRVRTLLLGKATDLGPSNASSAAQAGTAATPAG